MKPQKRKKARLDQSDSRRVIAEKNKSKKAKCIDHKLLNEMVGALTKVAGEGTTQLLGGDGLEIKIRGVFSTQCPTIDAAIGRGGIPLGKLTIIHGREGSGKTTLALHVVAECQRQGGIVLYVDSEYKLDPEYAANIGVDVNRMILSQPPYLEKFYEIAETAMKLAASQRAGSGKKVPILIVLDSMDGCISKEEYDGAWTDRHMAPKARIHSQSLPKLNRLVNEGDVALLFISQVRDKIGVMFGNKEGISGGWAPKFYASLIMEVSRTGVIKNGDELVGNHTSIKVRKNSIAPPFRVASFDIIYGKGIDYYGSLVTIAEQLGVVEKSGSWYSYGDERLGQGLKQAAAMLSESPGLTKSIQKGVDAHGRKRKND